MENLPVNPPVVQSDNGNTGTAGLPAKSEEVMPRCVCGEVVRYWSALLEQGFCSDRCYGEARGSTNDAPIVKYIAHGQYEVVESEEQ